MDKYHCSVLGSCSPCISKILTNTPMPLRTHVKVTPGVVIRTDVAVMNLLLIGGVTCLTTFVNGGEGHVIDLHMK